MDLSVLAVLILLGTVVLRVLVVAGAVWLLVPRRIDCPQCAEPPLLLVSHWTLRFLRLERRWCYSCGWSGISKRSRRAIRRDVVRVVEEPAENENDAWRPVGGTGRWTPENGSTWLES